MAGRIDVSRRGALGIGLGGLVLAARPAWAFADPSDAVAIDALVARFMAAFEIPGIGIAIVRPGQEPFTRGYGLRALGSPGRVDADTLFAIASNSKSFLAACLAMLVEEGKFGWDEPVVRYMPDFAMHDPVVTRMMTVRDLLVHRSGLPLGAGDLMQFPLSDHTREDLLRGLRYLRPARGFRTGYDYDNILYVVAGILVERVTGLTWEDFLTERLLRPLGMGDAVAVRSRLATANVAGRHARLGPPLRGMGPLERVEPDESLAASPAGGIHASASGIVHWLRAQLGRGALPDGGRLWSEAQSAEMWRPQVISASTPGPSAEDPVRPVLAGYALGWVVQDYRGRRLVGHSGGLSGQITFTGLFPESGIGFAVFSNTEDRAAVLGLRNALVDHLLGEAGFDWAAASRRRVDAQRAEALRAAGGDFNRPPPGGPSLPLAAYTGRYRDPWYGDVVIAEAGGRLSIDFTRTPVFKSALEPWGQDAFRTRFARGVGEDAVATFQVQGGAVTGIRMRALSPFADFSYDFHDLALTRVE